MGALFNFTSVDDKATAANVRTFFRDDLSHLERLSGQSLRNALSSPRLSENGSNGNHAFNGVENAAINSIDAKNELSIVAEVLNQCSESTRKLITDRYINGLTVWQAASAIGYVPDIWNYLMLLVMSLQNAMLHAAMNCVSFNN